MSSRTVEDLTSPRGLLDSAKQVAALRETVEWFRNQGGSGLAEWTGLEGSSKAWALAAYAQESDGPLLWVHGSAEAAEAAREDLEFFLGRDRVLTYPEPETPPYESHGPHPEITALRFETLFALLEGARYPIVTTVRALAQRVPGPGVIERGRLTLQTGDDYPLDKFIARLAALGYERQPMVSAIGDFAVRGGIVDLFAVGDDDPWRLEFDDQTLASMRRFDVFTQRSIESISQATVLPRFEIVL